jgi:hypothetical protein
MRLLVRGKRVLEDGLERREGHRYLRTRLVLWQQGSVPYRITPTIPATSGEANAIWTSGKNEPLYHEMISLLAVIAHPIRHASAPVEASLGLLSMEHKDILLQLPQDR